MSANLFFFGKEEFLDVAYGDTLTFLVAVRNCFN